MKNEQTREQITTRVGVERRDRLERVVEELNASDPLRKTNPTAIINVGIDRVLDELEAELAARKKKTTQS